jgi:hypothetical protein
MGTLKIKGQTSGSVSLKAPDTGSDAILTLPGVTGELLPLAGGKILQIVRATDSTTRSTTSTSFVDASISVTITPQKNNSAILLIYSAFAGSGTTANTDNRINLRITDNSNNVISGAQEAQIGLFQFNVAGTHTQMVTLLGYSTPATTNSVTYKARFSTGNATVTASIFNALTTGQLYAIEVSA